MKNKPLARTSDIIVQKLEDETLFYDLKVNKAFCLNETAILVWDSCNGQRTIAEIAKRLEKKLGKTVNEDVVLFAIKQLSEDGLLNDYEGLAEQFSSFSRREAIRKIAFASAIAIPLITSVVAPSAVSAQSGLACFENACTGNPGTCFGSTCAPGRECCAQPLNGCICTDVGDCTGVFLGTVCP